MNKRDNLSLPRGGKKRLGCRETRGVAENADDDDGDGNSDDADENSDDVNDESVNADDNTVDADDNSVEADNKCCVLDIYP